MQVIFRRNFHAGDEAGTVVIKKDEIIELTSIVADGPNVVTLSFKRNERSLKRSFFLSELRTMIKVY